MGGTILSDSPTDATMSPQRTERASGERYPDYVRRHILAPLADKSLELPPLRLAAAATLATIPSTIRPHTIDLKSFMFLAGDMVPSLLLTSPEGDTGFTGQLSDVNPSS